MNDLKIYRGNEFIETVGELCELISEGGRTFTAFGGGCGGWEELLLAGGRAYKEC
jgi:hypothetical protein